MLIKERQQRARSLNIHTKRILVEKPESRESSHAVTL